MALRLMRTALVLGALGLGAGSASAQSGSMSPAGADVQRAMDALSGARAAPPLAAEASRLLSILETQRDALVDELESLGRRQAELERALEARPTGTLPATDEQIATRDALRARIGELEGVDADDPAARALRAKLENFIARAGSLQPVVYPSQSFDAVLALRRVRAAADLRTGPDAAFPARGEVRADAAVLVLAEQRGGPWRLVVADDRVGYVRSGDLGEF